MIDIMTVQHSLWLMIVLFPTYYHNAGWTEVGAANSPTKTVFSGETHMLRWMRTFYSQERELRRRNVNKREHRKTNNLLNVQKQNFRDRFQMFLWESPTKYSTKIEWKSWIQFWLSRSSDSRFMSVIFQESVIFPTSYLPVSYRLQFNLLPMP